MSEKPIAIILASIGVASLCIICVLGPTALGANVGWAFGWVTNLSPMATIGVTLFSALAEEQRTKSSGKKLFPSDQPSVSNLNPFRLQPRLWS